MDGDKEGQEFESSMLNYLGSCNVPSDWLGKSHCAGLHIITISIGHRVIVTLQDIETIEPIAC